MSRILSVGFDLAWAGDTGYAVINGGTGLSLSIVTTGCIKPPSYKKRVTDLVKMQRGLSLMRKMVDVLCLMDVFAAASDMVMVSYEDPTTWLLAAAKKKGKQRRPVTRDSLFGAAYPLVCCWQAVGMWMEKWFDLETRMVAMDTQKARREFGVDHFCNLPETYSLVNKLLEDKGFDYDDPVKARVGAAVCGRLHDDGVGFLPKTDHEADAMLMALVALDKAKMGEI